MTPEQLKNIAYQMETMGLAVKRLERERRNDLIIGNIIILVVIGVIILGALVI